MLRREEGPLATQAKFAIGPGAVLLALALTVASAQAHVGAQASVSPAPTPEQAVAQAVEARQAVYAGDCASTQSPQDIGKVCSKFIAQRATVRAYLVGATFSEFGVWVFVTQTAAGWLPLSTAPFDASASGLEVPWPAG